mmetsp:Transcript_1157/g.1796  ORF Transcript_1157/g.1796 Transcript_1157/m.1796 type:complete len:101 (+) Transcript_1157:159-461(+)
MLVIYSKEQCKYCHMAKDFMKENSIPYKEVSLDPEADDYATRRESLVQRTQQTTFPWIFVADGENEELIGGYTEFMHAYNTGRLHTMLKKVGIEISEADF